MFGRRESAESTQRFKANKGLQVAFVKQEQLEWVFKHFNSTIHGHVLFRNSAVHASKAPTVRANSLISPSTWPVKGQSSHMQSLAVPHEEPKFNMVLPKSYTTVSPAKHSAVTTQSSSRRILDCGRNESGRNEKLVRSSEAPATSSCRSKVSAVATGTAAW